MLKDSLVFFSSTIFFPFRLAVSFHQLNTSSSKTETRKNFAELDEGELFMELIKDVANELDIDVLSHKILVNVGLLTHADRSSLFLVKGNCAQSRYLVAKLFDVTQDTGERESLDNIRERMCFISIMFRDIRFSPLFPCHLSAPCGKLQSWMMPSSMRNPRNSSFLSALA
jgi:hypothetical protein